MQPRFYLKSQGKNDEPRLVILFFNYRIGKQQVRFTYSTQIMVPPSRWNKTTQKAKAARDYPQHTQINAGLNLIARSAETIYWKYKGELRITELTKAVFKEQLDITLKRQYAEIDFLSFMRAKIAQRKKTVSRGTWKNDEVALGHLEQFTKSQRKTSLYFEDITVNWAKRFHQYLFDQYLQNNYVHKMVSKVKQFMKLAKEEGKTDNTDFQSSGFQVSKTKTTEVYLSIEELKKIESKKLSEEHSRIRDLFLVLAYTGVRFSDVHRIRLDAIVPGQERKLFRISTQKTGQTVTIPAHPIVLNILNLYGGYLPEITIQYFNREIKEVCRLAGITTPVDRVSVVQGKEKRERVPKWDRIYSHTGRRSFATNTYLAGMRPEDIIKITGHADVKTLLVYIRADDLRMGIESAKHEFFKSKEKLQPGPGRNALKGKY